MALFYRMKATFLVGLLFLTSQIHGQNYLMDGTDITDCDGFFLDSGGGNGSYGPNEDFTTTICATGAPGEGTHAQLIFSGVNLPAGDTLYFYDGPDTNAPLLGIANFFTPGDPFIVQATAANPGGCITFHFVSDATNESEGWSADINCVASCQTIQALLVDSDPPVFPADTGWIDACPGERISFSGAGMYPQDGLIYNHSDLDSEFHWDFGDGGLAVGPNVTHIYEEPGGYVVQLTIIDQMGCTNTNFITQRVRISPPPNFAAGGTLDTEICAGDTINLNAIVGLMDADRNISVTPGEAGFQSEGVRSDSLALPDGTGVAHETSISFTEFSPGQVLTNIDDLLSICVNIEHSWMRDLEISIICPDGTEVILHDHPANTGSQVYLGEPNDFDGANPIPGVGYDYCWTPESTTGTWLEYANDNSPPTLPPGDYTSYEPLSDLLGCPLNGQWTIHVEDLWEIDNGFIFSWGINFDPSLYPDIEVFSPDLVDYAWVSNPTIFYQDQDSIAASPQNAGLANYEFTVTDEFGCNYDTSINITVLPLTHPDCYNCADNLGEVADTIICEGEMVDFDVSSDVPLETEVVFETFPQYPIGEDNHPPANPYNSIININSIFPTTLNDPTTQIISVCFDLETDFDADIEVYLRAPSGETLELTTNNGGAQDNYTNTCFTPNAATPITAGNAPFTGDFQPEGDWADLNNADIIGDWTLLVSDQFGNNMFGVLNSWSITFMTTNEIDYTWTNSGTLTCDDCPTPTASPTGTTTYQVSATDNYGCTFDEDVTVNVINNQSAPDVSCEITGETEITFTWPAVNGIMDYDINVITDGVPTGFQGPYNGLSYVADGLNPNSTVTLEVRVYTGGAPLSCTVEIGSATCTNDNCFLSIDLVDQVQDVSCFGLTDGAISTMASDGAEPYAFSLDGSVTTQGNGNFSNLAAGGHFVVVSDQDMCTDTLFFNVDQPDELVVTPVIDQVISCNGEEDGILNASVTGGNTDFEFTWNTSPPSSGALLSGIGAGNYTVSVEDNRGCTAENSIMIDEPELLTVALDAMMATCNDSDDGQITAIVQGGTGDYTYNWDNGLGDQDTHTGLQPGQYCVTVEDENGCEANACIDINAPDALVIESIIFEEVDCFGNNTGSATVTVSGGTGNYEYLWSDSLAQISATAVFLPAGTYTVIVTDEGGCQITGDVEVTQPDLLEINFDITDALCKDESNGAATAVPQGGTEPYEYAWETGAMEETAEGLAEGSYVVSVTDARGCEAEATVDIGEPAEAVSVMLDQTVQGCFGQSENEAIATPSGGTGTNYTYTWSDGQISQTAVSLDSLVYAVTVTDENGCTAENTIELQDLTEIDFIINTVRPSCFGYTDGSMGANLVEGGSGSGYTYQWSTNQFTSVINNLSAGIYTVTVMDSQGCETVRERELPQPPEITFEFDITDVLCNGDQTGAASVINIEGENNNYTFQWDANAGGSTNATAENLGVGTYSVIVTDDENCSSEDQVVIEEPTAIEIAFELKHNECHGDQEGAVSAMVEGGIPNYTFEWSSGSDQSKLNDLPAGEYVLSVTDENGCLMEATAIVTQPDRLELAIETEDVTCYGDRDGTIYMDLDGGTQPYSYSLDNQNFNGASTIVGLTAGTYDLFIRDANGCRIFDNATINEPDEFIVDAGEDRRAINLGDTIQLFADQMNGEAPIVYEWSSQVDSVLSCMVCRSPFVETQNTVTLYLDAYDARGCEASDIITIVVNKDRVVLVPTGFTPNNDNTNDRLLVHGKEGTRITLFQIFDRWGELVYENSDFMVNDPEIGWDGTFRNEMMSSGVYIWYIEAEYVDGATESFKGQTTLIR